MKRREKFEFIPVNRCLHHSMMGDACEKHQSLLPEKLGLKPIFRESIPHVEQDYLDHWMNAPRFPVWDPKCPIALVFVLAIHNNHPCSFRYHGGSMPGAKRTVYPAQVFTVGNSDILYLAGWCMNTEAHRVFRIDRIQIMI